MRSRGGGAVALLAALAALWPSSAAAQPASGPREDINQTLTTKRPGAAAGVSFTAFYHATGNRKGDPPPMRRMAFYPPRGLRYDTTVPARCTASDAELEARGPDACPPFSRLGSGTTEGLFYVPFAHQFLFDHFHHHVDVMNGPNQQIILVKSEGYTVVRGYFRPDGSLEFDTTTCFPAPPAGGCADNYIVQLRSANVIPVYKRAVRGRVRSYLRTPRRCPQSGAWRTTVKFWWVDGKVDSVVTKLPCTRRAGDG